MPLPCAAAPCCLNAGVRGAQEAIGALLDELVEPCDFFWRADHNQFLAFHVTADAPAAAAHALEKVSAAHASGCGPRP